MSELAQMIAVATNPQLFFDGQGEETQDIIDTLKEEMELLLLGGIFADYMEEDADHS